MNQLIGYKTREKKILKIGSNHWCVRWFNMPTGTRFQAKVFNGSFNGLFGYEFILGLSVDLTESDTPVWFSSFLNP